MATEIEINDEEKEKVRIVAENLIEMNKNEMAKKILSKLYYEGKRGISIDRLKKEVMQNNEEWSTSYNFNNTLLTLLERDLIEKDTTRSTYFKLKEDGVTVIRTQKLVEKNIWEPVKELLKDETDIKLLEIEMKRSFLSSLNELKRYR